MAAGVGRDLDEGLQPFLEGLGRKPRGTWAPLYMRGLLGPGERKSLQPMALQLGLGGHDQLQHFIASPAWDDGPLWTVLARQADRMIGGPDAVLRACKILGDITRPLIELDDRWRSGSLDNDGERHPRASRSAPRYERRGRAARSSCSSASVVSCSCAWPRSH